MIWCRREPTLQEILSDPITKAVMQADGVDPQALAAMIRRMAQVRAGAMEGTKSGEAGGWTTGLRA